MVADEFLACGVLEHDFARIRCDACAHEYLLAFSCGCRYVCPSWHAKQFAIWMHRLDTTFLAPVPHRQVVLTIPQRLRADRLSRRPLKPWITLDKKTCQYYHCPMFDIHVIDDPAAATVALDPMRSRLLSELAAPASAATLATRVGVARQKVNYHLHALEAHGLVRLAQERKWGGLTERLLVATAASYVVSPSAMGPVAVDPIREVDRLSASYLIALGARVVREVGDLVRRANASGKRLATLAVDTEVRFRSPTDRAAFSHELTEAITKLVSKYHDASTPGGRAHRLVVVAHPLPQTSDSKEPS